MVTLQPVGVPDNRARHHRECFGHLTEVIVGLIGREIMGEDLP